jgi:formylmethanofuran dehydrogenase subunit E
MKNRSRLTDLLRIAVGFHGHLGPFLVLGLRMGILARRLLKPRGVHGLSAMVWTRRGPPQSCVIDGIQISSGCTMGKGNIKVKNARHVKVKFQKGKRSVVIRPKEAIEKLLSGLPSRTTQQKLKHLALQLYSLPDRDLLEVG